MRFALPHILWALFSLPLVATLLWWSRRRAASVAKRFAEAKLWKYLAPNHSATRSALKPALLLLSFALVILAAARPQWGFEDRVLSSRGLDMIVAVDTSLSMLAQDYKPNRLARARELLREVIRQARGDRIGVIAFAGSAVVKCPLTLDYRMALNALGVIDENAVETRGTAIGTAIRTALKAFEAGSAGERVLVLLTDGEDQGSDPLGAADEAARAGVRIYTIGIGTTQGMPIPMPDGQYKQDRAGRVVNTRLDFLTLTKIAEKTRGKAVKANPSGRAELKPIFDDLAGLELTKQQERIFRVYHERFQWFLLPAMILLVWEAIETGRRRRVAREQGDAS
ncbi:MAG: VWA domain-containing protein [Candidatus Sumerlaeaceae bacterium]|nr:VWA domain-containing protein [Candidatus Sumerlaeaceae bacterium]